MNVSTFLRVRPILIEEKLESVSIHDTLKILDHQSVTIASNQKLISMTQDDIFIFNKVFNPQQRNTDVFTAVVSKSITSFLANMHSYKLILKGEKHSGSSYTLLGKATDPGLLIQFVGHLYLKLDIAKSNELTKKDSKHNLDHQSTYKLYVFISL